MKWLTDYWPAWVLAAMVVATLVLMRIYSLPARLPYRSRGRLVTKAELRFYKALLKASQDDFEVFAMVRMADLLRVEEKAANRRKWINRVLAKHIDFVLCDPGSLEPRICIELDDSSHNRPDRHQRDEFVDRAFESAGLPLLRIGIQKNYPPREIRQLIDDLL